MSLVKEPWAIGVPREITPNELAVGQHIQVRYDYDQHRSTIWEGLVLRFNDATVWLVEGNESGLWLNNEPLVDVTVTLLAEAPKPKMEVGTLADVVFNVGTMYRIKEGDPIRAWWTGDAWRLILGEGNLTVAPKEVISVNLLRIAGPEDVVIPVVDGKITLGDETRTVHDWMDTLANGLGSNFSIAMAKLFCKEKLSKTGCCPVHGYHAYRCTSD